MAKDKTTRPTDSTILLGLGGAGCNAVAHIATGWADGPTVVSMDTDGQSLAASAATEQIVIGQKLTKGHGAGGDRIVGRKAAEESREAIADVLQGADLVFMVLGLGGGTGTGAASVVARKAREAGALTLCFVTTPFTFEGEKRKALAQDGLRELQRNADLVICLHNDQLMDLVDLQTNLEGSFAKSDEMLGISLRALWKDISRRGVINISLNHLRNTFKRCGGAGHFGYGEGQGEAKAARALEDLLENPLLEGGMLLRNAAGLIINITGSPDMTLAEIRDLMTTVTAAMPSHAEITMGTVIEDKWHQRVAITALVFDRIVAEPDIEEPVTDEIEEEIATASESITHVEAVPESPKKRKKAREQQAKLNFDYADKGRFKNVEPTLYDGEDLDIPTFIRRGIKLSTAK